MKKAVVVLVIVTTMIARAHAQTEERATFAGGCFWCMEPPYQALDGVKAVTAGYAGGSVEKPTYEQVSQGTTGHLEAIQISFDPAKVSYETLLAIFWRQIDPLDEGGQFADRGSQYRTAIFYHSEQQRKLAEASKKRLAQSGKFKSEIATEIRRFESFYPAEEYHQDYYRKNPEQYARYKEGSGRKKYLERTWADDLKKRLTPLQCAVTQDNETEPPFRNEYWDNKREGLYVDVVSGEPLFSSRDKFDSGTGWPSFTRPVSPDAVVEYEDTSLEAVRTEVKSAVAGSHLGHVFTDGPEPTGLRYCINSAALRFIPVEDLEKEGYGHYRHLFE